MAGHRIMIVLIVLAGCFVGLTLLVRQRHSENGRHTVVRRAVAESIGLCTLALSREGTATRYPMEGCVGCLGDIPGGYCLRAMCDVVTCPEAVGKQVHTRELARAAVEPYRNIPSASDFSGRAGPRGSSFRFSTASPSLSGRLFTLEVVRRGR